MVARLNRSFRNIPAKIALNSNGLRWSGDQGSKFGPGIEAGLGFFECVGTKATLVPKVYAINRQRMINQHPADFSGDIIATCVKMKYAGIGENGI